MLSHVYMPLLTVALPLSTVGLMVPQVWRSCIQGRSGGLSPLSVWFHPVMSACWLSCRMIMGDRLQVCINSVCAGLHMMVLAAMLTQQPQLRQLAMLRRSAALPGVTLGVTGLVLGALLSAGSHQHKPFCCWV